VLPEVPRYLLKGKGYTFGANEMYETRDAVFSRFDPGYVGAIATGDYHNGPLSVIMPFGIAGAIGFVWFLAAALRYLHWNYRYGDASLKQVNTFLLAAFAAKTLYFLAVFGGLHTDLFWFTGLIGFSVSLNGQPSARVEEPEVAAEEVFATAS